VTTFNLLVVPKEEFKARTVILKKQAADEAFLNVDMSAEDRIAELQAAGFIGPVRELERRQEVADITARLSNVADEYVGDKLAQLRKRVTSRTSLTWIAGYNSPYSRPVEGNEAMTRIPTELSEPITPEAAEILLAFFNLTGFDDSSIMIWSSHGDSKLGCMAVYVYRDVSGVEHIYPITQWGKSVQRFFDFRTHPATMSQLRQFNRSSAAVAAQVVHTATGTVVMTFALSVLTYLTTNAWVRLAQLGNVVDSKEGYVTFLHAYGVPAMEAFRWMCFQQLECSIMLSVVASTFHLACHNRLTASALKFVTRYALIAGTAFVTLFFIIGVVQGLT